LRRPIETTALIRHVDYFRVAIRKQSRRTGATLKANSRLSCVVSIFPVVGHAGIAEDKSDELGEARLGANIVREDDNATLSGLDADHAVSGLTVVAAFVEAVALHAVEDDDAQGSV